MIRPLALLSCWLLLSSTTLAGKPDDPVAAEYKALVGNYKVAKAELGGKDITEHLKEMKFEIRDGGKYTAQVGELKDDATFTADPAKKPKEMDVKPKEGPNKGQTREGDLQARRRHAHHVLRPREVRESPDQVRIEGRDDGVAHHLQARQEVNRTLNWSLAMIRLIAPFACCLFLSSASLGGKPDDAAEKDLKALVGKFKIEKAELGGKDITEPFKELKFEIPESGKYKLELGGAKG